MDDLHVSLVVLFGFICYSHGWISGSELEVTVRPGDNVTVYCNYKVLSGVYVVWFRICSHENQPPLVLDIQSILKDGLDNNLQRRFHHYELLFNKSSQSFDLMILNITKSDEGLYYCGAKESQFVKDKTNIPGDKYRYDNITTRIALNDTASELTGHKLSDEKLVHSVHSTSIFTFYWLDEDKHYVFPDSDISRSGDIMSWMMVFMTAFTILSSFLSFILVYHFSLKADKESPILQKRYSTGIQPGWNQVEDECLTQVVFWAEGAQQWDGPQKNV